MMKKWIASSAGRSDGAFSSERCTPSGRLTSLITSNGVGIPSEWSKDGIAARTCGRVGLEHFGIRATRNRNTGLSLNPYSYR
jgi:hypothetical protein